MPLGIHRNAFLAFKHTKNPLNHTFLPEVIDKFPRTDYSDSPFPDAMPIFVFTEGIRIETAPQPIEFIPFVITTQRNTVSRKMPRLYISSLIFYEALTKD